MRYQVWIIKNGSWTLHESDLRLRDAMRIRVNLMLNGLQAKIMKQRPGLLECERD